MANIDLDGPPILENQAIHAQQPYEEHEPIASSSTARIKAPPIDDDPNYGTHDIVGDVVEGADGTLYLIAEDDDGDDGGHVHQGVVDINNVREVKVMMENDQSQMIYFDSKRDLVGGPGHLTESAGGPSMPAQPREDEFSSRGLKSRRNRVYGSCRCQECGQTFVNTARLERHLAVHQMFGNFSCPLCGKTYKYEYNLFYHWRKTCRDLDDVFSISERKDLDVNTLRSAVEDLVRKKDDFGPMEMPIAPATVFSPYPVLERRLMPCSSCGVAIQASHMGRHMDLHRGIGEVDQIDHGSFFCDLCGLMFRQHFNLLKHWRVSCPEVQANLAQNEMMDMSAMKGLVRQLLRSVVVEHPSIREMNLREKARQYESAAADLNFPETMYRSGHPDSVVFTDDVVDDPAMMEAVSGGISNQNRAKWLNGMPVQCHECKRVFANVGRLERHMAGFHTSTGSHHCPLCGNRFKYDYNLLYHYRRSCPYTKSFIEGDVRQSLDAPTLRKLVRSLATKDLRSSHPEIALDMPARDPARDGSSDSAARRDTIRPDVIRNLPQIPPNRPGMPEGRTCPLCGIMFYGLKVLDRHVQAAHRREYHYFDPEAGALRMMDEKSVTPEPSRQSPINRQTSRNDNPEDVENPEDEMDMSHSSAPYLEEQPPMEPELEKQYADSQGPLQIVDDQGNVISEVSDLAEVQQLIAAGQLGLRSSDRFVVCQPDGGRGEYLPNNFVYQNGAVRREYEPNDDQLVYYEDAPLDANGNPQDPDSQVDVKYDVYANHQQGDYAHHYEEVQPEMSTEHGGHEAQQYHEQNPVDHPDDKAYDHLMDQQQHNEHLMHQQQELTPEQAAELGYVDDGAGNLQYVDDMGVYQMTDGTVGYHEEQQEVPVRHSSRKRFHRQQDDEFEYMPIKRPARRTPRHSTSEAVEPEVAKSRTPRKTNPAAAIKPAVDTSPVRRSMRQHVK
uniref:C2H2-type domain-containing protein n=1 Tax=Panagrellus redivivus TaxID=6233 RepID=A0A7E4VDR2_PANRE